MSPGMRRYAARLLIRSSLDDVRCVAPHDFVDSESRQGATTRACEHWPIRRSAGRVFGEELLQQRGCFRPQGTYAPLIAFSMKVHTRVRIEVHVTGAEAGCLLDTRSGVVKKQQQSAIAKPGWCRQPLRRRTISQIISADSSAFRRKNQNQARKTIRLIERGEWAARRRNKQMKCTPGLRHKVKGAIAVR